MGSFDPKSYEREVVKPLRGRLGQLPDDLVSRYAIELDMSDEDVARRLAQVRSHWNKSAQSTAKPSFARSVYQAFLRADEELERAHGDQMLRISWWREHAARRAQGRRSQIDELVRMLRAHFGDLGLISTGQLAAMHASFPELAPEEIDQALATAGLRASTPMELPKVSGLRETVYQRLTSLLAEAGIASVPESLHPEIERFWILSAFRAEPATSDGLTGQAVLAAMSREDRRSGNRALREVLGILNTAAKDGVDLHQLSVFHLLEEIRQHHEQGAPASALLRQLQRVRLAPEETRQAVVSVLSETGPVRSRGLPNVTQLLEEGRLFAARQAANTLSDADDAATAQEWVRRQEDQVRQLRESAREDVRAGEEDQARQRLRQAAALAVDDADLAAELSKIPLPPPLELSARPEGIVVRVSWRASTSHDENTVYRLVRRKGRVPADSDDGDIVTGTDQSSTATVAVDTKAPAGEKVGYAVFASADGTTWSRPAGASIEVLPPVYDVRLSFLASSRDQNVVQAHWRVHPDVSAVEVRKRRADSPDATGFVVANVGLTSFRDSEASSEASYVYTITARYRRADGTEGRSTPVATRTSVESLPPVSALRVSAIPNESTPRVSLSWRQPEESTVRIRRSDEPPPWAFSESVSLAEVADYGQEIQGIPEIRGDTRTLSADVPVGRFWYVPLTVNETTAVCGQDAVLGLTSPVTGLSYQRFGAELVLSWVWPPDTRTAEVSWTNPEGSGHQRLTKQQYQSGGGCRLHVDSGPVTVSVSSVSFTKEQRCTSPPAVLEIPGRPPKIFYTVERRTRPLVGGGTVRVRLTSEGQVPDRTIVVVAASGPVMPRRPEDGHVLHRETVSPRGKANVDLVANIPKLRRPYWIRCFLSDQDNDDSDFAEPATVELIDPPTTQLKVP